MDDAKDGQEALYLVHEVDYDLAIVDLGLPNINGIDVIGDQAVAARGHHLPYPNLNGTGQLAR